MITKDLAPFLGARILRDHAEVGGVQQSSVTYGSQARQRSSPQPWQARNGAVQ
jgi:hypothetical protein